jgi:hypothetical protein
MNAGERLLLNRDYRWGWRYHERRLSLKNARTGPFYGTLADLKDKTVIAADRSAGFADDAC